MQFLYFRQLDAVHKAPKRKENTFCFPKTHFQPQAIMAKVFYALETISIGDYPTRN